MKNVLISIQPKYAEKIANGEKTIEVRKTRPKQETQFKCYIYMTQGNIKNLGTYSEWIYENRMKVIAEFVCDKIEKIRCVRVPYETSNNGVLFVSDCNGISSILKNTDLEQKCLSLQEIVDYVGLGDDFYNWHRFYGWHISDLKIYDKPKELSEFRKLGKELHNIYKNEKGNIVFQDGYIDGAIMTRPPQSWCYVEEL